MVIMHAMHARLCTLRMALSSGLKRKEDGVS